MSWNFRVLAFESKHPIRTEETQVDLRICEVYYNKNDVPRSYAEAQTVTNETKGGLRWRLLKMLLAINKPILWAGEKFPKPYRRKKK